jgi:hypothetical protein
MDSSLQGSGANVLGLSNSNSVYHDGVYGTGAVTRLTWLVASTTTTAINYQLSFVGPGETVVAPFVIVIAVTTGMGQTNSTPCIVTGGISYSHAPAGAAADWEILSSTGGHTHQSVLRCNSRNYGPGTVPLTMTVQRTADPQCNAGGPLDYQIVCSATLIVGIPV